MLSIDHVYPALQPVGHGVGMIEATTPRGLDAVLARHGLRVAKVQARVVFRNDKRGQSVGREVQVVRIVGGDGCADHSGACIDRDQVVAVVEQHPKGLQVVRRNDVSEVIATQTLRLGSGSTRPHRRRSG